MYAEVKGVRGRALGARAQGGGDEQEGTASEVVLHWRAPPFGVAVGFLSGNPRVFVKPNARAFTFTFTFNRHRGKFYWLVMAGRYLSVSIQAFNLKFSCVSIQAFNLKFSCRSGRGPVSSDTPETSKKQTPKFLLTISSSFR